MSPEAPNWIIRGGSSSRTRHTPDCIIQGQVGGGRHGLDHPGQNKQERPQPPGLDHPDLDQDCPGRIKQKEPPTPGLERAGEPGSQKRRRQEAEANVVRR